MNLPTRAHFFAPQAMLRRRASPSSRRHRPRADPPSSPPLASSSPTQSVRHFITLNNKPYPDVVNGFNSDEEAAGRHGVYHYPNHLSLPQSITYHFSSTINSFVWNLFFFLFLLYDFPCADFALCLHYSTFSSYWSIRTGAIMFTTNSSVESQNEAKYERIIIEV